MNLQKTANSGGRRKVTCTDHEVTLAIELVVAHGVPPKEVAAKFEVTPRTVRRWVDGTRRRAR